MGGGGREVENDFTFDYTLLRCIQGADPERFGGVHVVLN